MMSKRLLCCLVLCTIALFLGACDQLTTLSEDVSVSEITNAQFYVALQVTVARVQVPVLLAGVITLLVGWKLGRFGLAINGLIIGGLIVYTALNTSGLIPDETFLLGVAIAGGIVIGLIAYFLYSFMALIIGGAIGMTLMNGAWLQISDNVPPAVLVFVVTFISALVMFVVFRLFLVAFSAVMGAVILMLAVPYETLWVIPVAGAGIAIQILIALGIKDDIFKNLRGDLGAALGEAFGEVLGPFAVLRERQHGDREKPAPQKSSKPAPEPQRAARSSYQPPSQENNPIPSRQLSPRQDYPPVQPPQSRTPAPQQDYRPAQPAQQGYNPVQPVQQPPQPGYRPAQPGQPAQQPPQPAAPIPSYANPVSPATPQAQPTPQPPAQFRPEDFLLTLSDGQSFPLVGSQMTVGRTPDNHIVINDSQVSSYHLICSIQADGVVVWDNTTTNGTYLNGVLLTGWHRLTTSDVLQVGPVSLRLTRHNGQ